MKADIYILKNNKGYVTIEYYPNYIIVELHLKYNLNRIDVKERVLTHFKNCNIEELSYNYYITCKEDTFRISLSDKNKIFIITNNNLNNLDVILKIIDTFENA